MRHLLCGHDGGNGHGDLKPTRIVLRQHGDAVLSFRVLVVIAAGTAALR